MEIVFASGRMRLPPPLTQPGQPRSNYCDFPHWGSKGRNRTLDANGISIGELAKSLAQGIFRRPVIDRTDLAGRFNIHLEWTPDTALDAGAPERVEGLSIFTALREQLGLRVVSVRAPAEVIVVDRMEKPSAN